jgi:hypothetical protein
MSHSRLVSEKSSQVHRFGGIVLGEGLYLSSLSLTPLLGKESYMTVSRSRELPVRLLINEGGLVIVDRACRSEVIDRQSVKTIIKINTEMNTHHDDRVKEMVVDQMTSCDR